MDEELKKLVEIAAKNTEDTKKDLAEIKKMVKSIKNHFIRDEIYSFVRFLIIVVPLVVGTFYLLPFVQQMFGQYQQLMGLSMDLADGKADVRSIQDSLSPEMLKMIEAYMPKQQ